MSGNARIGAAGEVRRSLDGSSPALIGGVWLALFVSERYCHSQRGIVWRGRQGKVEPGADRFGIAGLVRLGLADL